MIGRRENVEMTDIYYVEDDQVIARAVQVYLEKKNFRVRLFSSVADGKKALSDCRPSAVLVDWNMPDGRGDELCCWIRRRWAGLPVIFITVRGEARDMVSGFHSGADDYVVKPFDLEVLYSRIAAVLRRAGDRGLTRLTCDQLTLDREKNVLFCEGEEVALSRLEYELLLILMENKGRTVTRKQLLEQVWDSQGNYVNDNTLTVTMKRLREKLPKPSCVKTIRSFGYRMEDSL